MIVIFFSHDKKGPGERLLEEIQTRIHAHRIEVDHTVEAFSERFRSPMTDRPMVILVPESRERLEEFVSMADLMSDIPILLVLPDREPATISVGHRLYPRFVEDVDSDFSDLVSVLIKMIHHGSRRPLSQPNIYADFRKNPTRRWKQVSETGSNREN
ncbi:MAG: hypothetical protein JRJ35_00835 [Deltaproteobacteria bacterium]|nr:hypothetical protein [Deltaproteobacteria bacterium]MBW2008126.1 hypothetical protein [Deltaproteobacteria bacterium]